MALQGHWHALALPLLYGLVMDAHRAPTGTAHLWLYYVLPLVLVLILVLDTIVIRLVSLYASAPTKTLQWCLMYLFKVACHEHDSAGEYKLSIPILVSLCNEFSC
jgi:hypothetical protein